jgi:hypothetical protein
MVDPGTGTAENYPVFTVAGGRVRNQTFVLDGGNVSNAVGLTRPQQLTSLPVDAMQEFQVVANNYSAEHGHSTGGIVLMSTRAGTSEYHGSLFESLQNDVLNARNFFAPNPSTHPIESVRCFLLGGRSVKTRRFSLPLGNRRAVDQRHYGLNGSHSDEPRRVISRIFAGSSGAPVLIYDPSTTSGDQPAALPWQQDPLGTTRPCRSSRRSITFRCRTGLERLPTQTTMSEAVQTRCIAIYGWGGWTIS